MGDTWLTIGQALCVLLILASMGVFLRAGKELAMAYTDGGMEGVEEHFRYFYAWTATGEYVLDPDVDTAVAVRTGTLVLASFLLVGIVALMIFLWLRRARRSRSGASGSPTVVPQE